MTRFVTRRDGGSATCLSLKQTSQSDTEYQCKKVTLDGS
jgi:hypothetical protein